MTDVFWVAWDLRPDKARPTADSCWPREDIRASQSSGRHADPPATQQTRVHFHVQSASGQKEQTGKAAWSSENLTP